MSRARTLADLFNTDGNLNLSPVASINSEQVGGRRNLIINGAMQVAQRGTSETGITAGKYANAPDRFSIGLGGAGTWTAAQSTDAPDGFSNSYRLDCTTANASLGTGNLLLLQQAIEGQNLQHLKKGTSSAESVTVSFYVKSNKTGTYIAELYDADNTRQISQAYTISSANTWEKKTLTYAGDTSGTLDNDNAVSLYLVFWLAAGSGYSSGTLSTSWTANTQTNRAVGQVNLADSTDNDWSITGIQLEVGELATSFEHRSFGDELLSCYRYCYVWKSEQAFDSFADLNVWSSSALLGQYALPIDMNHDPAIEFSAVGDFIFSATGTDKNITALSLNRSTPRNIQIFATDSDHGFSSGVGGFLRDDGNNNATLTLEAEL